MVKKMSKRPEFHFGMTSESFLKYYWYKTELEQICRENKLPSLGTKAELTGYIVQFLEGKSVEKIVSVRKIKRNTTKHLTADQITLETKLLNSGFSLNNEARKFFANYYGVEKFTFRKAMGIKMRSVETAGDTKSTVADLIAALESKSTSVVNNDEEKTYQWNNFVKDFRQDQTSKEYSDFLKVAALLWKFVRDSDANKSYSHELLVDHMDDIKKFHK